MDLTHLNNSLYPRAVTASAEGRLRPENADQVPTARSSHRPQAANATQSQAIRAESAARQYQAQESAQWQNAEPGRSLPGYADVPGFGEQLAVASRQARQVHERRGYTMPARVSARGREANRRYLDTPHSSRPRFIDELV